MDLDRMLAQLQVERGRVQKELYRLDEAISALGQLVGRNSGLARAGRPRGRRKFSAAARKRMAQAQKARWAKLRKEKAAEA